MLLLDNDDSPFSTTDKAMLITWFGSVVIIHKALAVLSAVMFLG